MKTPSDEHEEDILGTVSPNTTGYTLSDTHVQYQVLRQEKAAAVKTPNRMRWHSLMIRLCLRLKYFSSASHEILRTIVCLPSARTLRDYTNWFQTTAGMYIYIIPQYKLYGTYSFSFLTCFTHRHPV